MVCSVISLKERKQNRADLQHFFVDYILKCMGYSPKIDAKFQSSVLPLPFEPVSIWHFSEISYFIVSYTISSRIMGIVVITLRKNKYLSPVKCLSLFIYCCIVAAKP